MHDSKVFCLVSVTSEVYESSTPLARLLDKRTVSLCGVLSTKVFATDLA